MALIEREHELTRIEARLDAAVAGRGSTLLIEGSPGIGKTALLDAVCERATERGARPLRATGSELERGIGFGVVRQLFDPALREAGPAARRELLGGAAGLAEGPLGLRADGDQPGAPPAPGSELHGLYWLCANLADRGPLLLAIDDLHWADEPSLRFLAYLAHRANEHPLLVCATSRSIPGEVREPLPAALAAMWSETLRLRALSDGGVARVIRDGLSADADPEFCAACARATGGNPFLLSETLVALREEGVAPIAAEAGRVDRLRPETISRTLLLRVARLGPAAGRVAHAIAILGSDAVLRRVARLAELEAEEAAATIDALRREDILAPGSELGFTHPLVRNAVYADLAEPSRGLAHLHAARLLDSEGEEATRVARHLLPAEPSGDPWVVAKLHEAAAGALSSGAPEPAIALLERALAEPPREAEHAPLRLRLGRALARAGHLNRAVEALSEAMELNAEPPRRAEVALELSSVLQLAGRWRVALEVLEEAVGSLDRESEHALRLDVEIVFVRQTALEPAREWVGRLEEAAARAPEDSSALGIALAVLAFTAAGSGSKDAREVSRLAALAADIGVTPVAGPLSAFFWVPALALAGRPDQALEATTRAVEAARRSGDAPEFSFQSVGRSRMALESGRVREAEADARNALDAFAEGPVSLPLTIGVLVLALVARGRIDAAQRELVRHGLEDAGGFEALPDSVLLQARGTLRLAQGRLREAARDLHECGGMLAKIGFTNPPVSTWRREAALAHLGLGEEDVARRLAAEELDLAAAFGAPPALGAALRTMALVEAGERGIELLRESVSVLDRSPAELEHAHSLVELGSALRRAGRRRDSRQPLRRGLDLASRCGAAALADRARDELITAGARPRRTLMSGPESLTASELRVARLAIEGMTNREIAQALFVTRRTVEVHLTSAYRKLDIDSREALGPALQGQGRAPAGMSRVG